MKICIINGQNHRGSTYHIGRMLADKLADAGDITEFFLPRDFGEFCCGCTNCFMKSAEKCPHYEKLSPITRAVDEADLLALMEEDAADAYTAEKEATAQAAQERKQAEEDAKNAAEEAAASSTEQAGGSKVTKYAATFLGVLALVGLAAGGSIYAFMKQKQKKQAEKEALDPDANYTEDKGDFEIPVEDEPEETGEEDNAEE